MASLRHFKLQYELWALGQHLEVLERQLVHPEDNWTRMSTDLQVAGASDDDVAVELAIDDHNELVDKALPRLFRGAYVVVLWAVFEAGVIEVADSLREKGGKNLALADIRDRNLLDRARKYWDSVLGMPFCPDQARFQALEAITLVRNVIAHSNGRISAIRQPQRKQLSLLVATDAGLSEDHGLLLLSEPFVRTSYRAVRDTLEPLIDLVRQR